MRWWQLPGSTFYRACMFLYFLPYWTWITHTEHNCLLIFNILFMRKLPSLTVNVINYYSWFKDLLTLILIFLRLFRTFWQNLWSAAPIPGPTFNLHIHQTTWIHVCFSKSSQSVSQAKFPTRFLFLLSFSIFPFMLPLPHSDILFLSFSTT